MSIDREVVVSRRALLQVAAIGGAAVLIFQPSGAFASASVPSLEERAGDIDAYVAATALSGFTDLTGIHAEYRDAAAKFPFALPSGWSFPARSTLKDRALNEVWERGIGVAEVYLYWQSAVATVAYDAQEAGDIGTAQRLLDTLESGYNSPVRRAVLEDQAEVFIKVAVGAARGGDFRSVRSATAG